jgi:transcriptional regulator CtsR
MNFQRVAKVIEKIEQNYPAGEAEDLVEEMFENTLIVEQETKDKQLSTHRQYLLKKDLQDLFEAMRAA